MSLVPQFDLTQTDSQIHVAIFVPAARLSGIEVALEGSALHCYARPYLLKLNFSPEAFDDAEQGNVSAKFDPDAQVLRISLLKANPGTEWKDLDMIGKLIAPTKAPCQWLHAVTHDLPGSASAEVVETSTLAITNGYGFRNAFHGLFSDFVRGSLAQEMLHLPDPEGSSSSDRLRSRLARETSDFNLDRFLADQNLKEDHLYVLVLDFKPRWERNRTRSAELVEQKMHDLTLNESTSTTKDKDEVGTRITKEEKLKLSSIPYPLLPQSEKDDFQELCCGLLDLLVPYVYDHTVNLGEASVESSWTISTLSCSLSWLNPPKDMHETVISLTRRMLIYPYWRNVEFSLRIWRSTLCLLEQGAVPMIKSLLDIRNILDKSESYYLGNKLFVDPYLHWLQLGTKTFDTTAYTLEKILRDYQGIVSSLDLGDLSANEP